MSSPVAPRNSTPMEEDEELLSGNWCGHGQASDVSTQNMATSPPPANLETNTQVYTVPFSIGHLLRHNKVSIPLVNLRLRQRLRLRHYVYVYMYLYPDQCCGSGPFSAGSCKYEFQNRSPDPVPSKKTFSCPAYFCMVNDKFLLMSPEVSTLRYFCYFFLKRRNKDLDLKKFNLQIMVQYNFI